MTAAFAAARRLVENHRDQVLVITKAGLLARRHKLARWIVKKLAEATCPKTFREISRYSRDQKKEKAGPVVAALIEAGVLVRDADGMHTLGAVDLVDVEAILDQMFARS